VVISEGTALVGAGIAVGTIIANAAIAWAAVARLEHTSEKHTEDIQDLKEYVAVLRSRQQKGGEWT